MADYNLQYQDTYIDALLATVNELKSNGYIFKGVATPSTNPGTTTEKCAYIASEAGTYTNFNNLSVTGLSVLTYNGSAWSASSLNMRLEQTTGQSNSAVMSQKAVTDKFNNNIILQQGYLNASDGSYATLNTRGLSDYLKANTTITCKSGYFVRGIYRFTKDYTYVNFTSYATIPFASFLLQDPTYYYRVLFQKGDGNQIVTLSDVIESVRSDADRYLGTNLYANVELGAYNLTTGTSIPSKTTNSKRMRCGGLFKTAGMISIKCKDGYQCTITSFTEGASGQIGYGWGQEHHLLACQYDEFIIHFKRNDNGNVSSSDLNCVDYFYYDDIYKFKWFNKESRGISGYTDLQIKCNKNVADTITESLALQDSDVEATDNCRLYLPSKYSEDGEPTRLIIHCHGASVNYNYNNFSDLGIDTKFLKYFTSMGYAVLFVSGMAGNTTLSIGTTAGNPLAYQSHVKAYKYVVDKYNIRQDGCFVYGISAGSIPALQIANFTDIPVLAQIIYCGIYSVPRAFMLLGGYVSNTLAQNMKQYIADEYDMQGSVTWSTSDPVSDAEWKYLIDNVMRFAGWNTFLKGATTKMSQSDYADFVGDYYGTNFPSWIDPQNMTFDTIDQLLMTIKVQQKNTQSPSGTLLDAINAEKTLYDSVSLNRSVPLKIFHATNDNIAPYRYAKYYYEMLKRGGSQVEFRTFPSGGHSPYGNDVTVTMPNGTSVNTCVTAIESLLFCQRFE